MWEVGIRLAAVLSESSVRLGRSVMWIRLATRST